MPVASRSALGHLRDRNAYRLHKSTVRSFTQPLGNNVMSVILGRWRGFQRARTEEKKRNVRRRSWKPCARQPWTQVAPVTLSGIAKSRRFPNSAMRRYFNFHEVLLAEGSTRWSNRVCASLREPAAMSPSRVTEKLARGPVAGTPFCGLLRQPPPDLENAADPDKVVQIRWTSAC